MSEHKEQPLLRMVYWPRQEEGWTWCFHAIYLVRSFGCPSGFDYVDDCGLLFIYWISLANLIPWNWIGNFSWTAVMVYFTLSVVVLPLPPNDIISSNWVLIKRQPGTNEITANGLIMEWNNLSHWILPICCSTTAQLSASFSEGETKALVWDKRNPPLLG